MAKPGQLLTQPTPQNCGGRYRPYLERGTGVIAGTTKVASINSTCRVFLHQQSGALLGFRESSAAGAYQFLGLLPGEYRLVIEDGQRQSRRSKVEHVIIP